MSLFDLPAYLDLAVVSANHWEGWTPEAFRPYGETRFSQFKAAPTTTYRILERELNHLEADPRTLYVDMDEAEFRLDGRPRKNAPTRSPAVVLEIGTDGKTLEFVSDQYQAQQENLRAIALTLESLRAVERYGATRSRQQYGGFEQRAIEAGTAMPAMTVDTAWETVLRAAGYDGTGRFSEFTSDQRRRYARRAQFATHPDQGGDLAMHQRVNEAQRFLDTAGAL